MKASRLAKGVHLFEAGKNLFTLQCSDIHFDSIHCDHASLKAHFDKVKEKNGQIFIYGDLFDVMGCYKDPRSKSADINPAYIQRGRAYLDLVIEDVYEFLKPYRQNIAFIGMGNHECYHPDTEVLTKEGWKNITQVRLGDSVAVFDKESIWYENPTATVKKKAENIYKIESSRSCQWVSDKHNVVLSDMSKIHAEDITDIKDNDLPGGMIYKSDVQYSDDIVELITAVVMDATIVDRAKYGMTDAKRIQFKISKPEKIEYLRSLLDRCDVKYTFKEATMSPTNKLQPYYIRIYSNQARGIFSMLNGVKTLPDSFRYLTGSNFKAFIKALENTDAYRQYENTLIWRSTEKHNVDIVQSMCAHNGWLMSYTIRNNASGFSNGKPQYISSLSEKIVRNTSVTINKEPYNDYVYCLTVPQGNFVSRINGKVAYSGNTAILKHRDTDPIDRLIFLLNQEPGHIVQKGSYSGWIILHLTRGSSSKKPTVSFKIRYHHGKGGTAKRSKGILYSQMDAMEYPDANMIVSGHDHNKIYDPSNVRRRISRTFKTYKDTVHWLKLGSYAMSPDEDGYVVEKGYMAKRLGGWFAEFEFVRDRSSESEKSYVEPRIYEAVPLSTHF